MALSLIMIASLCSPALAVDDSIANDESTGYVLDESFGKMALPNRLERSSSDRSYLAKYRETYSAYQSNYNFNLNMGNPSGYIISQESCPNYHVGNSRFSRVGCEIAATYNALTAIGRKITVCYWWLLWRERCKIHGVCRKFKLHSIQKCREQQWFQRMGIHCFILELLLSDITPYSNVHSRWKRNIACLQSLLECWPYLYIFIPQ